MAVERDRFLNNENGGTGSLRKWARFAAIHSLAIK